MTRNSYFAIEAIAKNKNIFDKKRIKIFVCKSFFALDFKSFSSFFSNLLSNEDLIQ